MTRTLFSPLPDGTTITEPLDYYGQARGKLVITGPGASLSLFGQIAGDLIVRDGAKANIYGQVAGDVRNEGGDVLVSGMVAGNLLEIAGSTKRLPGSVVIGHTANSTAGL